MFRASRCDHPLHDGNPFIGSQDKKNVEKWPLLGERGCKVTSGFGEVVERFLGFKNAHCSIHSIIKICQ